MVYLQNTQESQILFIPKNSANQATNLSLMMRNTIGLDYRTDEVIDLNTSQLYYNLAITLPAGVTPGEYEYSLLDGLIVLSTGILVIEDTDAASQYNKTIEYEQYETE